MRNILITGANRGIGFELAQQYLLNESACVYAACRDPENADNLNALKKSLPSKLIPIRLDVTDQSSILSCAQTIAQNTDHLDILINNAGINPTPEQQNLETIEAATMRDVFHVNVAAPLMVIQAHLALLRAADAPKVVNISSQAGSIARKERGGSYAYSTSKSALNMVTRILSHDLGDDNTIVIALDPGWVQTDMGGHNATLTPEQSVKGMRLVIEQLTAKDNGAYLRWNGDNLPW